MMRTPPQISSPLHKLQLAVATALKSLKSCVSNSVWILTKFSFKLPAHPASQVVDDTKKRATPRSSLLFLFKNCDGQKFFVFLDRIDVDASQADLISESSTAFLRGGFIS